MPAGLQKSEDHLCTFLVIVVVGSIYLTTECVIIIVMLLENEIKEFARSQGADLVAVAPIEVYSDYLAEVKDRLTETGADMSDYMIQPAYVSFF